MKGLVGILILLSTTIYPSLARDTTCYSDLILVGIHHPIYTEDTEALIALGNMLYTKSPYFSDVCIFSTGKELLNVLKEEKRQGCVIRHLLIMGHSGFQGYFVKELAGFYRDGYEVIDEGRLYLPNEDAAFIEDLKCALENGDIEFSKDAIVVLSGCNTAHGKENIANDMAKILKVPVIGANQKVDLFNVDDPGEDMKGLESRSFYAYLPMKDGSIELYNFGVEVLKVSEAIRIVREKVKEFSTQ
ncbi:MAG TPA: hypothetical protein VIK89_11725 [Cytophagaceae bacterium]